MQAETRINQSADPRAQYTFFSLEIVHPVFPCSFELNFRNWREIEIVRLKNTYNFLFRNKNEKSIKLHRSGKTAFLIISKEIIQSYFEVNFPTDHDFPPDSYCSFPHRVKLLKCPFEARILLSSKSNHCKFLSRWKFLLGIRILQFSIQDSHYDFLFEIKTLWF